MLLGGLQKTTLIDYPGKVACTVFLVGCNFRCPFCHNKDLVTLDFFKKSGIRPIKEKGFFDFLGKRKKLLDGICITGGEPCVNRNLPKFIKKIKDLGFQVKLDTNGSYPEMLEKLIKDKLIDFIAMDIKTAFDDYQKAVKVKCPPFAKATKGRRQSKVKSSIELILKSGLAYEFRTTVVPGIHNKKVMVKLARDLRKTMKQSSNKTIEQFNYVLQQFRPKNCLDPKYLKVKPYSGQEMKDILKSVQRILPRTKLRGGE